MVGKEMLKRMPLVDIGGEDSKMIFFEPGRVPDMRMNGNCAGGTGAFIDQTATLLGVDRIFYPWVVYERAEDEKAKNSFNCPIVSGYSDVLKSSIRPEEKYGIPLDATART